MAEALSKARKTIRVNFSSVGNVDVHPLYTYRQDSMVAGDSSRRNVSIRRKRIRDVDSMLAQEAALDESGFKGLSSVCYLINAKWFEEWRSAVDDDDSLDESSFPIDNSSLVEKSPILSESPSSVYAECLWPVRSGLIRDVDFVALSENIWNALYSWYGGGPPLPRLITRGVLDISTALTVTEAQALAAARAAAAGSSPSRLSSSAKETTKPRPNRCFCCQRVTTDRCKACSVIFYCSRECQVAHWKFHKNWCKSAAEYRISQSHNQSQALQSLSINLAELAAAVGIGRLGKTGLVNLGNSCFMNSGLQCLSQVAPLTRLLLSDRYIGAVNKHNLDGSGGELVAEYSSLLRELWFGSSQHISPFNFKRLVGRINPDYAGISQHDVHELLEFFIDKIHEDLNKVGKKPYTEIPEGDGTNDVDISRLAWERHGMRHDSIVKDVFGGQLRSQLVCPACSRVSVKFDYFTTLQLAIPLQSEVVVKVLYVPTVQTVAALSDPPMLVSIKLELNKNGRALKAAVAERISNEFDVIIDPTSLELFEVDPETRLPVAVMMNSTVISEITGSIVFAYSKQDKAHDGFIFIFNRAIIFPESIESEDDASVEVLGYPILISFETSWSVAKVRFQIWLQLRRFVRHQPCIDTDDDRLREIRLQMLHKSISERLPLRAVNQVGRGVELPGKYSAPVPRVNADFVKTFADGIDLNVTGSLSELTSKSGIPTTKLPELGSLLPIDKDINFVEDCFIRRREFYFLSMDWSGDWLKVLNDQEINSFFCSKNRLSDLAEILLKSTRVRTESEIPTSLDDCFAHFVKEEVLDESNSWYCSNCKEHRQACKKVNLWQLPEVLVLGLKRYKQQPNGSWFGLNQHRRKIDNFVEFPLENLNLKSYTDAESPEMNCVYDLFAVCNHYGRMGFGHYTAATRSWEENSLSPVWYSYDDDVVGKCSLSEVKTSAAYVLFYRKRPATTL